MQKTNVLVMLYLFIVVGLVWFMYKRGVPKGYDEERTEYPIGKQIHDHCIYASSCTDGGKHTDEVVRLMKIYSVDHVLDLVAAQAKHIGHLQNRIEGEDSFFRQLSKE